MNQSYDAQTINSINPLARFAHRRRLKKSIDLILSRLTGGKVLDYGAGAGALVAMINAARPGRCVGFEPFMSERFGAGLPVFKSIAEVTGLGPFQVVTLFETIEHLTSEELNDFLEFAGNVLENSGGILISFPIEIGPALLLKEFNRSVIRFRRPEHGLLELIRASILAVPARRARDIKTSHRGFDFRQSISELRERGWSVSVLGWGPLPIGTWYGNSQGYLWVTKL